MVKNSLMLFSPSPKALQKADCPTYASSDWLTHITPAHPILQTPSIPHTPQHPKTQPDNSTPAIPQPYTHPIPLPCELECSQASTKWTPRVVQTRRERSSKAVCCERGRNRRWMRGFLRILPRLRRHHQGLTILPKTTQIVKKLPN